jgi:hypothetical protein
MAEMNFPADRFRAKFPAPVQKAELIPCARELIPCSCLANTWNRRRFRDKFSQKTAESEKFPAFFPAIRELYVPRDRGVYPIAGRQGADYRETGHARKTRIMLATAGIQAVRLRVAFDDWPAHAP